MKLLLPLVVVGLILAGFVSACLAACLAPSSDYILSQLVTTTETITTPTQTTQIYAIIVTETTTAEFVENTTTSEVVEEPTVEEVIEE